MSLAQSIVNRAFSGAPKVAGGYDPTGYVSPWTDEKDQQIIKMRLKKVSYVTISNVMGMDADAVRGRAARLKAKGFKFT